MEYLVLERFRSYGKVLYKNQIVDESEIRSPRLRRAEGKIIPAVSSFIEPAADEVTNTVPSLSQVDNMDDDIASKEDTSEVDILKEEDSSEEEFPEETRSEEAPKKVSLHIKK